MLTNTSIANAKTKKKLYRINDGNGLCLEITPKGAKRWRFRYRFGGKEKMLSLGFYPAVTLKSARIRTEDLRRQLAEGLDPSFIRKEKVASAEHTFQVVALEWLDKYSGKWSEGHAKNLRTRLERGIFPDIGELPISDMTPPLILEAIRKN